MIYGRDSFLYEHTRLFKIEPVLKELGLVIARRIPIGLGVLVIILEVHR